MHSDKNNYLKRPGFTLIEILVTIAIILILAGLSFWGFGAVITNRHRNNTTATMSVVNRVLQNHWKFVIDEARKECVNPVGAPNGISPAVYALAQPDDNGSRAQVLWTKFRLMEAFPQSFAEIKTPFVYSNCSLTNSPYIAPNQARYNVNYNEQIVNAKNTKPVTQSSACLRIALSINRGSNALTDDMIKQAVTDSDNDGVPEIVDSWGNPLQFFRFAWNNSSVHSANPGAGKTAVFADPIDTGGSLINKTWYFGPQSTQIRKSLEENLSFHPFAIPKGWAFTPNTLPNIQNTPQLQLDAFYAIPVIVSAGPDGKYGFTVITPGAAATTMPGNPKANTVDKNPETLQPPSGIYIAGGTQEFHPEMSVSDTHAVYTNDNIYSFQLK